MRKIYYLLVRQGDTVVVETPAQTGLKEILLRVFHTEEDAKKYKVDEKSGTEVVFAPIESLWDLLQSVNHLSMERHNLPTRLEEAWFVNGKLTRGPVLRSALTPTS